MLNVIEVEKKDTGNILNRKTATQRIKKIREKILNSGNTLTSLRPVTSAILAMEKTKVFLFRHG